MKTIQLKSKKRVSATFTLFGFVSIILYLGALSSDGKELECGNLSGDSLNTIGVEDITPLLRYLYFDSALAVPLQIADVNSCPPVDISDLTYLNRFVFQSGAAPCSSAATCSSLVAGRILLDSVSGSSATGTIQAGMPVTFWMTIENSSNINVTGSCNGFVISSPDGAQWSPTLRTDTILVDPPPSRIVDSMYYDPLVDPPAYPLLNWVNGLNSIYGSVEIRIAANRGPGGVNPPQVGQGADTVFVIGSTLDSEYGFFSGFASTAFAFRIDSIAETSVGKTLCIDTISIASKDTWKWAGWTGTEAIDMSPEWIGASCFEVVSCCQGMRGNINRDSFDTIDISDLTVLVGWLYRSQSPPPCLLEADVNGDSAHDILDLAGLVDYMFKSGSAPADCP